jgi:hypothetical protein
MNRFQRKSSPQKKGVVYFNFSKFEKLLDKLREQDIELIDECFTASHLKAYKEFRYFFETFSVQEIKSHLLFYLYQLEGSENI